MLCNSNDSSIFSLASPAREIHGRNVICNRCGLIYVSPRLSEEEYLDYYSKGDYVKDHYGLKSAADVEGIINWRGRRAAEKINVFPDIFSQNKNVLEVGSGTGVFLNHLVNKFGSKVFGIEPSREFVRIARERFNLEIYEGTLRSYHEEYGTRKPYDLIIFDQVLEHLYNPLSALVEARNLLQKNGFIYIGVPNIANPKHPRQEFFISPHVYTFNPWTTNLLLLRAELKMIRLVAPAKSPMYLIAASLDNPEPMFPAKNIPGPFSPAELTEIIDNFGA